MAGARTTAGVLVVLAACLSACGGKGEAVVVGDPTAEALAYVPAGAALVAVVQTSTRTGAGGALARLVERIPGAGLLASQAEAALVGAAGLETGTDLAPLRGNPVVVWSSDGRGGQPFAAWVVADAGRLGDLIDAQVERGALRRAGEPAEGFELLARRDGLAVARKGQVVVAGPDVAALRAVLTRRARVRGQWTPALLRERRLGLSGGAVVEVLADAGAVRGRVLGRGAQRVPWVAALQRVAVTASAEPGGLRLRARASTDPALATADVPIAGGVAPPLVRGTGPLVAAVRDPQHLLAFLRRTTDLVDPRRLDALRTLEGLLGRYAGVDVRNDVVGRLAGTLTLTSRDLRTATARSDVEDPGAVGDVLGRLGTIARLGGPLASLTGVDLQGYGVDERDGAEVLTRYGTPLVALAVHSGALVASTSPGADLAAAGAAAPPRAPPPPEGALRATVEPGLWKDVLVDRLGLPAFVLGPLAPFGHLVLTARGERTAFDVQIVVPVAG